MLGAEGPLVEQTIEIQPFVTVTCSLKVTVMVLSSATSIAPLIGEVLTTVGA